MTNKQIDINKWGIFLGIAIMIMMINLDATIIYLALNPIMNFFHSSITTVQWMVNIYLLTTAALLIFSGRCADIFGKKKIFLLGVFIFTIASVIAGCAQSTNILIIGRALQGIGFAATFAIAILIIVSVFPANRKGFALGCIIGVTGFSQAVGPTLGGFILHYFGWRWIFLMNLPLGIMSIFFTLRYYKDNEPIRFNQKIDVIGTGLLSAALVILITALNNLGNWGWMSADFALAIIAFIVLLVLFVYFERKISFPLIDTQIFCQSSFVAVNILRFIYMYSWLIILFLLPLYLQNIKALGSLLTGTMMLCMTVIFGILSPFMGRLLDKYGSKTPTLIALVCALLGLLCFATLKIYSTYTLSILGLIFWGVSAGIILSSSAKAALLSLNKNNSGMGMGAFYTFTFIGGAAGIAVAGSMLHYQALEHLPFIKTFSDIMIMCAGLISVAIIASFFLQSSNKELASQENDLTYYRNILDKTDKRLLQLIAKRFSVCREVAYFKKKNCIPMMQHGRVAQVKDSRVAFGKKNNLRSNFVVDLYDLIIKEACDLEDEIIDN